MKIALLHELVCIICKLGVFRFKCDFLQILFRQQVTELARKLGFTAIYSGNISTCSDRALVFYFCLSYFVICSKICILW